LTGSDGSILEEKKWQHMKEAKAMTYACYQMYARQPTGLSPEFVEYPGLTEPVPGKRVGSKSNATPAFHVSLLSSSCSSKGWVAHAAVSVAASIPFPHKHIALDGP
jgi:hypothetical protein